MKKLILLSLIFFGLLGAAQGQELRQVRGRVVQATDSLRPLPYVQVLNRTRSSGTVSDLEGYFSLRMSDEDKLEFRMIGYQDTTILVSDFARMGYRFPMKEKVVVMRPATIRTTRPDYKPFAPAEKSDDPYVGYRSVRPSGLDPVEQKIGLTTTGSGAALEGAVTQFANLFSKKEKQRKKIRELKAKAAFEEYYNALFNYWFDEKIVAELTGYRGGVLKDFLAFCKPSLQFLEETNEYNAILTIWKYQEQYEALYYR
ncbi:carboxypeptidase-like regulatory domain-containing protein [Cesiribacter andamanensis]|uniref:carboxypeptidase-like regulatory domain-containing protein n=1 Tax=Cesiribacter andamanensis TaxID=649507 RepID=UPI0013780065|nr:carboxypeptidase-like regulatory domain-containing protein [Cesiribacter andamanensis]